MINTLQQLYKRDFIKLKTEIEAYSKEEHMWVVQGGIENSGGNLCLHLIGNLKAFIGAQIGETGYVRDRTFEFSGKNVPREALIQQIEETMTIVEKSLSLVDEEMLQSDYPLVIFKEKMTYEFFLIHLESHLTYHLGQINYHRRLLDN